jgi:hypothetical protein
MDYKAILTERNGRHTFLIRELNIIGSGSDIASAHAALMARYAAVRRDYEEAGLEDELPRPARPGFGMLASVKITAIKSAIVLGAICVALYATALTVNNVTDRARAAADNVTQNVSVRPLMKSLRREMERVSQADPARREALLSEIRQFVEAAKPYVQELTPLFENPRSPPQGDGAR